jgi:hypothetical protein
MWSSRDLNDQRPPSTNAIMRRLAADVVTILIFSSLSAHLKRESNGFWLGGFCWAIKPRVDGLRHTFGKGANGHRPIDVHRLTCPLIRRVLRFDGRWVRL